MTQHEDLLLDVLHQTLIQHHHPRPFLKAMAQFFQLQIQAERVEVYALDVELGVQCARRLVSFPEPAQPISDFKLQSGDYEKLVLSATEVSAEDLPPALQALAFTGTHLQIWPCVSAIWEGFLVLGFAEKPIVAVPLEERFLSAFASSLGWMLHARRIESAWRSLKEEHGELERRLQTVISNLPGFVYRLKQDGEQVDFLSPGVFELTGFRREAFYQGDLGLRDFIHPDYQATVTAQIQQAVRLRQPYETTYLCQINETEQRWFWERGRGVFSNLGELRYYEGFITDITSQKHNEQALAQLNQTLEARVESRAQELQERQAIFNTIVNNAQDGIILINAREEILFWNASAEKIFGYSAEEVNGKNLHQLLAPDYYHGDIRQGFDHFVQTGEGPILDQLREVKARHKAGHFLDIELSISGVQRQGSYHAVGIVRDIGARKARETQLKIFHQLAEASAQGIGMMDLDLNIFYINPTLRTFLGEDSDEGLMGQPLLSFYSEHEHARFQTDALPVLLEKGTWTGEIELCSIKGGCVPTLQNFFTIENEHKEPAFIAVMITNIMQQKGVQRTLELAQKSADEANQAKSVFLANMSHEIRTPMNAIIGLGHLLQKTELTPKQSDYTAKIQGAAQNLLGIINDILDFSKIEANKMDMEYISFDLHRILTNISTILAVKAQNKDLELIFKIHPEVPRFLMGDPLRLEQVFLNLMNNALKFTEAGSITVVGDLLWETERELFLRFEVRDTGIGMSQAQQDKLFKAFSQADASTSRKFGGTGLGLTIAERLVHMMGGEIGLSSQEGVGSTFFFTLKTERSEEMQPLQVPVDLQLKHVLVVDDQPVVLEVMQEYLSHFKVTCVLANSGAEAIEKYRQSKLEGKPFDLVILDWNMPEMDGVETLAQLRQLIDHEHETKIFMMTAYGREDIVETLRKLHVDNLLLKPVTQSVLYDHLVEHLSQGAMKSRVNHTVINTMNLAAIKDAQVLVVEDNLINQQIAQELLEEEGLQVTVVQNGKEAVDLLELHLPLVHFDAVLMDLQMPIMDGYEATEHLRQNPIFNDLPIIAMTADAVTGVRERVLAAGMNDYVTKPIQLSVLADALLRWIPPQKTGASQDKGKVAVPMTLTAETDLAGLACLNYQDALTRMAGKVSLLERLLRQFVKENASTIMQLRQAVDTQSWEDGRRLAHTLKGSAGNLGLEHIFKSAYALEKTLVKPAQRTEIMAELDQLEHTLMAAIREIDAVLASVETPPPVAIPSESTAHLAVEVLTQLQQAIEHYDATAGEQLAGLLAAHAKGPHGESLQAIADALDDFEQEQALAELVRLRETLTAST